MRALAAALEFKQRVRALPELPARRVRERRTPVMGLGLFGWAAAVCIGLGIDRGYLPVKDWAARLEAPSQREGETDVAGEESEASPPVSAPGPELVAAAPDPRIEPAPPQDPIDDAMSPAAIEDPDPEPPGETSAPTGQELPSSVEIAEARARVTRTEPPEPATSRREPEPPREPESPASISAEREEETLVSSLDEATRPAPKPARDDAPSPASGTSCEAAVAANEEEVVMGRRSAPDLSREHFASILENGRWFGHCEVSSHVAIDVCVAVRNGSAVGVTVQTRPRDRAAERCVSAAARRLSFPSNAKLDVTRTTFKAE